MLIHPSQVCKILDCINPDTYYSTSQLIEDRMEECGIVLGSAVEDYIPKMIEKGMYLQMNGLTDEEAFKVVEDL